MSFADLGLDPLIVRNLQQMRYVEPTPIQAQALGPILDGRDVIGLAQTGTGKTAAFAAPVAHHLLRRPPAGAAEGRKGRRHVDPASRLRALVLCPTRELAQQVERETARITAGSVLRTACVYGKVGMRPQVEALAAGVDVLVATPGRLRDLLATDVVTLAHVRHVVVDEADRMLDMGFLPQVTNLLERMPAQRQTMLFSATMPGAIEQLASRFLDAPVRLEIGRHTTTVEHVEQHLVPVDDRLKVPLLIHLIEHGHGKGVLVFCRTRRRVGWVGTALLRQGHGVGMIHGDRTQAQRQRALDRFAAGNLDVVVATDVAARGLHIPAVRTVVNYDLPVAPEEYVHRVGRAGHGGGFGEAFTFLGRHDTAGWDRIADATGVVIESEEIEGFTPPDWAEHETPREVRSGSRSRSKAGAGSRAGAKSRAGSESKAGSEAARAAERSKRRPPGGGKRQKGKAADDEKKRIPPGRLLRRGESKRPIRKGEKPGGGVRRPPKA